MLPGLSNLDLLGLDFHSGIGIHDILENVLFSVRLCLL
jgi:hypothetical protein